MNNCNSQYFAEILQQREALQRLLTYYRGAGRESLSAWSVEVRKSHRIVFSGMGSSEISAELLSKRIVRTGVWTSASEAGELLYQPHALADLFVLISQSGESYETIQVAGRVTSSRVIAVTNFPESTLARQANLVLPIFAGNEETLSTKTFINTLGLAYLMPAILLESGEIVLEELFDTLWSVSETMLRSIEAGSLAVAGAVLSQAPFIHVVSYGSTISLAKQTALLCMEGLRVPACATTASSFRHGPLEIVCESYCAIFLAPHGPGSQQLISSAMDIADRVGQVVFICDFDPLLNHPQVRVLQIDSLGEDYFIFMAAPLVQAILSEAAQQKGIVVGDFRHIKKVTSAAPY